MISRHGPGFRAALGADASAPARWRVVLIDGRARSRLAEGDGVEVAAAVAQAVLRFERLASRAHLAYTRAGATMFNLIPKEVRFFDLFEQQSNFIMEAADLLKDLVRDFGDARSRAFMIKEVEHKGDLVTHEVVRRLNTTFITPIDREDIHALATRLDDVLDLIDAAAERLVVYRIKEPTSACRAMAEVIVTITRATDQTIRCLRTMDPRFHEHTVEVNRLENSADNLLRESLAALFEEQGDPIEVIKWKEIYETMESVTDRCEDVANVIEGIILKMA